MGKIHLLDTEVSNKIAAGEVVERPASVIKELVENSIDAGSTVITVEIRNGGAAYMRVTDNGSGMSMEDAKICFLRHATSKIQKSSDLDAIYTLGFRGEALSSIGAVARVSLYTKQKNDEVGVCVSCEGGDIISSEDAGTPDGTTIIVEDLFYNTPARMKFLKKDTSEAGYIVDIMTRFIFAHPEISFRLIVNGKEKLFSPGDNNLKNAVYTVYGKDYANGVISVDYEQDGIRIKGVIGKGNISRPKRNYQSFFVNSRYIKSPLMTKALEDAYKNQIMIGKFPVCVLNIEINPELVDINVHPTKLEVKFSNEREIYHVVYYGAKNALYELPNVPKIEREVKPAFKADENAGQVKLMEMISNLPKNQMVQRKESVYDAARIHESYKKAAGITTHGDRISLHDSANEKPVKEYSPAKSDDYSVSMPKVNSIVSSDEVKPEIDKTSNAEEVKISPLSEALKTEEVKAFNKEEMKISPAADVSELEENNVFIDEYFEIVGQIFESYIIAQKDDQMLIIDQHAAHERLKYEELKKDMASKQVMSQLMIEPVIVNVTGSEMSAFRENSKTFYDMGFECEEFGEDAVIVRGAPGEIEPDDIEDLLLELLGQAQEYKNELMTAAYERLTYTIACKAAVKANMKLSKMEMESLVREVLRLKNINTCPHGRPIIITMSKKEIEKEFKRIV